MKPIMKIFSAVVLIVLVMSVNSSIAQNKVELKDHKCTDACKNGCTFVHGEKGHSCDESCKTSKSSSGTLKDHKCTDDCKNGCTFVHGEKGHICSESCNK
jgi:hypothetical protein